MNGRIGMPPDVKRYRAYWDDEFYDYWLWDGKTMWIWNTVKRGWDKSSAHTPGELENMIDDLEEIEEFPSNVS
jgi:hypothetical protein